MSLDPSVSLTTLIQGAQANIRGNSAEVRLAAKGCFGGIDSPRGLALVTARVPVFEFIPYTNANDGHGNGQ